MLWRRRRLRGPSARKQEARRREISEVYLALVARLRSLGVVKAPNETPRAFARRVAAQDTALARTLSQVTETYNAVRFGARAIDGPGLRALRATVSGLRAT